VTPAGALTISDGAALAPLTTLELGGPARHFAEAPDDATLIEALRWADARKLPALILGGGSNVVISDAGFPGLVVRVRSRGRVYADAGGDVTLTAAAGEPWDALVQDTVARDLAGLECLSGIPGLVGATPIQNVGAYGQEVADGIRSVRVVERGTWQVRELPPDACAFAYRDSAFKHDPDRFAVLAVTFSLKRGGPPTLRYRELADAVAAAGKPPGLGDVRRTVLALRSKKSMVIADGDPNRRSVGSFFMNPVLGRDGAAAVAARAVALGAVADAREVPSWPAPGDRVKLSAGWLIEHAGIHKGLRRGAVGVSSAHALALVHHGGGTTAALVDLARELRDAVRDRFGVTLTPEPTLIGVAWPASEN
jgi:UDP-N-acetylmuramate dehydrogenase